MLEYKSYVGTVEADDGAFVGRVAGLRDVITFEGETFAAVEQAFRDSVDDYLAFCASRGEAPDRPYSGRISSPRRSGDPSPSGGSRPGGRPQSQSMDHPADRDGGLRWPATARILRRCTTSRGAGPR